MLKGLLKNLVKKKKAPESETLRQEAKKLEVKSSYYRTFEKFKSQK